MSVMKTCGPTDLWSRYATKHTLLSRGRPPDDDPGNSSIVSTMALSMS